ncbi:hypothetical protein HPB49_025826 [Dermacentor silvarum]|nr:hypothetical protein HPB49_025826 [Dermacentor silvarum]
MRSADGNYEVTIMTKAIIHEDGRVVWNPPAIYKSFCQIDVQYFPFDKQDCFMKFGSWTYDGFQVDLKHVSEIPDTNIVPVGIDLTEFYLSVEWDIMAVPAMRREKFYSCCEQPYPDITFNITLRRKTLFYTVNLIIPCVGISCLSVLVFYLPSDSGEKIIPPTSLAMPLLGKYLVFTMILVTVSVLVTIAVLNVHFRSPSTHRMAPWVRRLFVHLMPRLLLMRPPQYRIEVSDTLYKGLFNDESLNVGLVHKWSRKSQEHEFLLERLIRCSSSSGRRFLVVGQVGTPGQRARGRFYDPAGATAVGAAARAAQADPVVGDQPPGDIERAIHNAMFIAQHIDNNDDFESAPSLYDQTDPIDVKFSQVARRMKKDYPWTDV